MANEMPAEGGLQGRKGHSVIRNGRNGFGFWIALFGSPCAMWPSSVPRHTDTNHRESTIVMRVFPQQQVPDPCPATQPLLRAIDVAPSSHPAPDNRHLGAVSELGLQVPAGAGTLHPPAPGRHSSCTTWDGALTPSSPGDAAGDRLQEPGAQRPSPPISKSTGRADAGEQQLLQRQRPFIFSLLFSCFPGTRKRQCLHHKPACTLTGASHAPCNCAEGVQASARRTKAFYEKGLES